MKRRSPLGVDALSLAQASNQQREEDNAHGQVYRAGRSCVKLHAGGGRAERKTSGHAGEVVETNARALSHSPNQPSPNLSITHSLSAWASGETSVNADFVALLEHRPA